MDHKIKPRTMGSPASEELPQGGEPNHTQLIQRILAQHETFKEILDHLTNIVKQGATAPVPSGIYYNTAQTAITNITPNPPAGQALDPDGITALGTPNYQFEQVHTTVQRNAPKIGVINDGTAIIYVISTQNAQTWSNESPILPGEARFFYNVWSLGLRSETNGVLALGQGGIYRVTEYDFWLAYSSAVIASTVNRPAFTARSVQPINNLPATTQLPAIVVPNGFTLVIRATVGNATTIYLANSAANLAVAANRITLNAGDIIGLNITNANLVFVAGSGAGVNNVDILVEQ